MVKILFFLKDRLKLVTRNTSFVVMNVNTNIGRKILLMMVQIYQFVMVRIIPLGKEEKKNLNANIVVKNIKSGLA